MDEYAQVGPEAGPAIVVEITPRGYLRRGLVLVAAGVLLTVVSIWLEVQPDRSRGNPVLGLLLAGYGVYPSDAKLTPAAPGEGADVAAIDRAIAATAAGFPDHKAALAASV